jgi:hypothetical protein
MGKAAISLTTGLEDPEKVTVAFLVAVGAAESGRPTIMFLTKEAVRLAVPGHARAVACEGCPSLDTLMQTVCRRWRHDDRLRNLRGCQGNRRRLPRRQRDQGGLSPALEWIGDQGATTFSY